MEQDGFSIAFILAEDQICSFFARLQQRFQLSSEIFQIIISTSKRPHRRNFDMRGHGQSPGRRGDVDHVHQQEQDIVDLWGIMKQGHRFSRFFWADIQSAVDWQFAMHQVMNSLNQMV